MQSGKARENGEREGSKRRCKDTIVTITDGLMDVRCGRYIKGQTRHTAE